MKIRAGWIIPVAAAVGLLLVGPMLIPDLIFRLYMPEVVSSERSFRFPLDRFAFANETVWNYADGELQSIGIPDEEQVRQGGERYSRRCFVLSRAALQFFKFADFLPEGTPMTEKDLRNRVEQVVARDVWKDPLPEGARIVFSGFASLDELSRLHPKLLQQILGQGWTTYIRPGNFGIILPPGERHQERCFHFLQESLCAGMPVILWLVNFPSLNINHAILVFESKGEEAGVYSFVAYDPNDTREAKQLTYDARTRHFSFERTFYFPGGEVKVRPVFLSPLQ